MPANLTDVDAFTSPVVVPVDGDVRNAASVVQGFQPLADRTRNLHNKVRADLAASRGSFFGPRRAHSGFDGTANEPHWSSLATPLCMTADYQLGKLTWDLFPGDGLPFSLKITTIRVWVKQAAATSAAGNGNRMKVDLYRLDANFATTLVASAECAVGTGEQSINLTGLDEDLIATNTAVYVPGEPLGLGVVLTAGNVVSPNDRALFLEVRHTLSIL